MLGGLVHAQVVELALAAGQAVTDLTQAVGVGQVAEEHGDKLRPAVKALGTALGLVLAGQGGEAGVGNVLEQLTKQAGDLYHRGDSFATLMQTSVWRPNYAPWPAGSHFSKSGFFQIPVLDKSEKIYKAERLFFFLWKSRRSAAS